MNMVHLSIYLVVFNFSQHYFVAFSVNFLCVLSDLSWSGSYFLTLLLMVLLLISISDRSEIQLIILYWHISFNSFLGRFYGSFFVDNLSSTNFIPMYLNVDLFILCSGLWPFQQRNSSLVLGNFSGTFFFFFFFLSPHLPSVKPRVF